MTRRLPYHQGACWRQGDVKQVFRRGLIVAAISAVVLLVGVRAGPFASESRATDHLPELLPDLQTLKPKDIEIVSVRSGRNIERRLRFDNEIVNAHLGPLELYPVQSSGCKGRVAYQRIFEDTNESGAFERGTDGVAREVAVGCMVFHPQHRHWHLEDFARYELKRLNPDGTTGDVVASSTKVSFCIIDIRRTLPDLSGSPTSAYYRTCDRTSTNGLSVGWSDEYHSTLADQYIALPATLTSGSYCLVSTADPVNQIVESSESNNAAGVVIVINVSTNSVEPRNPSNECGP
jgi:hypothetical protein